MSILHDIARRILNSDFDRFHRAINWEGMLDPYVVYMKNGNVMLTLRYLPPDAEAMSESQMASVADALNRMIMSFGYGWTMYFDHVRVESTDYENVSYDNEACRVMHEMRRRHYQQVGNQYENVYLISFLFDIGKPLRSVEGALTGDKLNQEMEDWHSRFHQFQAEVDAARNSAKAVTERVEPFGGNELMAYLRFCTTTRWQNTNSQETPLFDMNWLLEEDVEFRWSDKDRKWIQKIGDKHHRTVVIEGQPGSVMRPVMLNALNFAPFALRSTGRYQPLDADMAEYELERRRNAMHKSAVPMMERAKSIASKTHADTSAADLNKLRGSASGLRAKMALARKESTFGYWNHFVNVWGETEKDVDKKVRWVLQHVRAAGFTCRVTGPIDAMPAFLGSIPGHTEFLNRLLVPSLSFAKVLPASAPWSGSNYDPRLDGPPLLRGTTRAGTAFSFPLHPISGAAGHGLLDGRTGSGKSVVVGSMVWNYQKYKNARVIIIDYLASSKGVTYAMGGEFYDLADSYAVSLQPLRDVDNPKELEWAKDYICDLLRYQGMSVTADHKEEINKALKIIATKPKERRTMTLFQSLVQDRDIWSHIGVYVRGGSCGNIIDNDGHRLGCGARVTAFEMGNLLENKDACDAAMPVVFHEIDKMLNGDPTLLIVDEAQVFVRHDWFIRQFSQRLETARKKYCDIWLVTPVLKEFADAKIASLISTSCANKIFVSNHSAREQENRKVYEAFGLDDTRIELVAKLAPARELMIVSGSNSAIIDQNISDIELEFIGRNSDTEKAEMDMVMNSGPRESYKWRWLKHRGVPDDIVDDIRSAIGSTDVIQDYPYSIAAE